VFSHIGLDASGEQGWCLSIIDGSDDVNSENDRRAWKRGSNQDYGSDIEGESHSLITLDYCYFTKLKLC
jgi:hypothetical protein